MNKRYRMTVILVAAAAYPLARLEPAQQSARKIYQCISVAGRTEAGKRYLVKVDALARPGLVVLAEGLDAPGKATVDVNGNKYEIPAAPGGLLAKIVIPLQPDHVRPGLTRIAFLKGATGGDYRVVDARIEEVSETSARAVAVTYLPVSAASTLTDFDFVTSPRPAPARQESDLAEWARRGKVRFYRAGIDFDRLDRMFEMFKEAHINIVMPQIPTPTDLQSPEHKVYRDFFERCHAAGIKVMYDGGNGAQPVRLNSLSLESVLLHPEMRAWISQDEYGMPRWRSPRRAFWPDLANRDYRNELLKVAEIALDAGADAFYFDWAIGKTSELVQFFAELRELANRKHKNVPIYGNCKGNILVEELCDFTKTEGTEEAGVWDGKWVNNVAQARFYYAAGGGWKPNESKYEGADPGAPDPGAHDVRNGMKCGWKRPIAEAAAFQSHFVIAEAGRELLQGWVEKNNDQAMTAWGDITRYYTFLAENEALYTDVRTVSNIALVAPPAIPSFEVNLARAPLYNALGELNLMYDIVLLPRLSQGSLAGYKAAVIPDLAWVEDSHLRALENFRKAGGQILSIGSAESVRKISSATLPASVLKEIQKPEVREEFKRELVKLSGEPLVTVDNAGFVIANLARKKDGRVVAHFINYGQPVENVTVRLNLPSVAGRIRLFSPDAVPTQLRDVSVRGTHVTFTIPRLDVYGVAVIE